jgi:hypothetical protein
LRPGRFRGISRAFGAPYVRTNRTGRLGFVAASSRDRGTSAAELRWPLRVWLITACDVYRRGPNARVALGASLALQTRPAC